MFWVWLSTTPRYRARLEQWIVASLCKRNADGVFRLVEAYPGVVGSSRRSEGRGRMGMGNVGDQNLRDCAEGRG